ncbi:MAG: CBS domain-containing protein [Gammaproteobacteria bacterium]|nr:CBS domain-containing protein [Gammaproteobacteria bacterium]
MNSFRKVIKVKDVMSQKFVTMDGMQTIREAINAMRRSQVGIIIVNKKHEDDSFGILLLSDIAKEVLASDRSPERVNVYEVMTKPVLPVSAEMDIRYCARLFQNLGLSFAPVIKNEELLGIIGYREIVLHNLHDE